MEAINKCGECTECCTVLSVKELDKPAYKKCSKCFNECTIYASRPQSCKRFNCTWLLSGWKKEYRPDRLKMVFCTTSKGMVGIETERNAYTNSSKIKNLTSLLVEKTSLTIELFSK